MIEIFETTLPETGLRATFAIIPHKNGEGYTFTPALKMYTMPEGMDKTNHQAWFTMECEYLRKVLPDDPKY